MIYKGRSKLSLISILIAIYSAIGTFFSATLVEAHAFGQFIALPLPLYLYYVGAGLAIFVTFIIIAMIVKGTPLVYYQTMYKGFLLAQEILLKVSKSPIIKLVTIIIFITIILIGFLGPQNPVENLATLTLWIIIWIGLVYVQVIVGDVWNIVNPWKGIFELVYRNSHPKPLLKYPSKLERWPGFFMLFLFIWFELIHPHPEAPFNVSIFLAIYTILMLLGMRLFGLWTWLRCCDFLSIYFHYLSLLSPIGFRTVNRYYCRTCEYECELWDQCVDCPKCTSIIGSSESRIIIRIPGGGVINRRSLGLSDVAFVILMLAGISFDGLSRTTIYYAFIGYEPFPPPPRDELIIPNTVGLIMAFMLFLSIYLLIMTFSYILSGKRYGFGFYISRFILSLIPIAVVYNMAHYMDYFWINLQLFIKQISDPLGYGWNIFGTATMPINTSIDIQLLWHIQFFIIVLGHIISVFAAHIIALLEFRDTNIAVRSQYPVALLMIGYTVFGLWLLSAPRGV